jgi:hypothetical protein
LAHGLNHLLDKRLQQRLDDKPRSPLVIEAAVFNPPRQESHPLVARVGGTIRGLREGRRCVPHQPVEETGQRSGRPIDGCSQIASERWIRMNGTGEASLELREVCVEGQHRGCRRAAGQRSRARDPLVPKPGLEGPKPGKGRACRFAHEGLRQAGW